MSGVKLTKNDAIAQALHDGFAPSNQIRPWRMSNEELKDRSRLYAKEFERALLGLGYTITPSGLQALSAPHKEG